MFETQLENDWDSLQQIFSRRQESITKSKDQLKKSVQEEDANIQRAMSELIHSWEQKRPLSGTIAVANARAVLVEFQTQMQSLSDKWEKVNQGRDALKLDVYMKNPLELMQTEWSGLDEAWNSVAGFWDQVSALGETLWSALEPKRLIQELGEIEREMEKLNSRVKQYGCFTQLQSVIRSHKKDFRLLQELKNSTLKERHWESILSILGIATPLEFLRLKDFWTPSFQSQETKIQEVLSVAQGELALEEFLKQLRENWNNYQLELVSYQQRCKVIRGWETLFSKLDRAHFGAGIHEAVTLLQGVCGGGVVVGDQAHEHPRALRHVGRRPTTVDLPGGHLHGAGADIIQQLPQDYNRFKTIDADFISLMRRVASAAARDGRLRTPNIQRTLERLSQQLSKIQKALGEFLEKQRQLFSRFYFVGDEDLLEILGNSKDPVKVQRHLNKMFAGINSLELESTEAGYRLSAMVSKEGEVVKLSTPVEIGGNTTVVSWLSQVETRMHETLAILRRRRWRRRR